LARARDESVNKTVLRLLEGAVGINERRERLARYTTWSREDLSEFAKILRAQRKIDRHLWK
jgi:hypothetical protein